MAEDWIEDVRKYVSNVDEGAVAGIVRHCGIALRSRDASLVSFSDPTETERVRESFLKKKLALTDPDDVLDSAISAVGERMKEDRTKNRVTVYYLLAEHFGLLSLFGGAATSGAASGGATTAAAAGAAALGAAALGDTASAATPPPPPPPPPPPSSTGGGSGDGGAQSFADMPESGGGGRWWLWLLLGLIALALLVLLLRSCQTATPVAPLNTIDGNVATTDDGGAMTNDLVGNDTAATTADTAPPAPVGAGVTEAVRNGAPALNVYFDKGKSDVTNDFGAAAAKLTAYLTSHAGAALTISGFNDPSGNAAINAEISKKRAQNVAAALKAAGVPESAITLVKPSDTTIASTDAAAARRVEVTVKQ